MSGAAIKAMNPVMHMMLRRFYKKLKGNKNLKGRDRRLMYKKYKDQLNISHYGEKIRNQIRARHYGNSPGFSKHQTVKNPTSKEAIKKLRSMASR